MEREDDAVVDRNGEILKQQYQRRFEGMENYRTRVWVVLCTDVFSRYIPSHARVLDLGAGWGEFINNVTAESKYAMDLNPDTKNKLAADVTFIQQDCSKPWASFGSDSLDVIFTSNFLEHLPDKVCIERAVAEAYRALKPGGCIICMGPNIKTLPGAYWDFWDHRVPLTDRSCSELLTLSGFSIVNTIAKFLPYTMSNTRKYPLFLMKWYLQIPLLWKFFGKQFLVIGRK